MATNSPTPPIPAPQNLTTRLAWFVLILATLYVCYFTHLGAIGFVGPDEPRYAWIARDMAETGDWVTPRLYGRPWFEKPPLYYWEAALIFKFWGVTEVAARLPGAISALLATLALAWLALRAYGAETARWVLLLLPTSVAMIGFSHAAATDMPFSAMFTIAMVAAAVLLRLTPESVPRSASFAAAQPSAILHSLRSSSLITSAIFGFFLGLAVLAKGPAALILCGGTILFWALITKQWRDTLRLFHPAGIIVFSLTALPWYFLCAHRNPDFFRVFIIEHNFKRFLTPEFQHTQPFWFYAPILLLAFLPWTAALIWSFLVGANRLLLGKKVAASDCYLLCWIAFCVLFFTISRSKLPGYVLPAVPAIGLLLSRSVVGMSAKRWSFGLASLVGALLFAGVFAAIHAHDELTLKKLVAFAPLLIVVLLAFALANLLMGLFSLFSRPNAGLIGAVLTTLLAFPLVDEVLPFTPASIISPRYLADQLQANRLPLADLRVAGLKRATLYGLNFYLRRDLPEWDGNPAREIYVLATGRLPCSEIPKEMSCSHLWGPAGKIDDLELLHLIPAASAPVNHP
jgi:4-amino-4-deoxy-L-arabinose transferase-like glycosyltransferase